MEHSRRKTGDVNYQASSKRKGKRKSSHRYMYHPTDWYQCQPVSEFSAPQWNSHGNRLYPTMSDSAVCGYSLPYDYPANAGLPIYPLVSTNMYPVSLEHVHKPPRIRKKNNKFLDIDATMNNNTNFTSLPPVNLGDVDCGEKRRFSDPGLNNVDESNESSSSESESDSSSLENESLLVQIAELKAENKRLVGELETTKNELKSLKSEFAVISNKVTCHEPLSLAQMVKEIRDAAEIREKVLLSKVESLINKSLDSKNKTTSTTEVDSLKKRLSHVEYQLEHLRIHSKVDSKVNGEATLEEIDNAAKRKHNSLDLIPKSYSGTESSKDEDSYTGLRLDVNTDNGESTSDCNGNSLSTVSYESLSSSLGPGSISSATLTVCGPVTDL